MSVNSRVPPNSLRSFGLFAITTHFAMFIICSLLITPPVALVPIAISFTFLIKLSFNRLGLPAFLKETLPVLVSLNLVFQEFTVVRLKLYLLYLAENFLRADAVPKIFAYLFLYLFRDSFLILLRATA